MSLSNDIRDLIHAQEFVPFEIHLRSGKTYVVPTRDHAWVTPLGRVRVVIGESEYFATVIINPQEIETVTLKGV
jgi:hypothetical protein